VRLLISDLTVSAGETFTEAMLARTPAPSLVGMNTQGVFADDMERKLPNGWTFTLGNEDYIAANGHNYEDVGIPPTIPMPVFSTDQISQHSDPALDAP
jgi:C-terminal processing protease CtpA/Prc